MTENALSTITLGWKEGTREGGREGESGGGGEGGREGRQKGRKRGKKTLVNKLRKEKGEKAVLSKPLCNLNRNTQGLSCE